MNFNETRELANVNTRAQRLFTDGYKISTPNGYPAFRELTSPEGVTYSVDTIFETCSCPYFTKNEGKKMCKHLLGWETLEKAQEDEEARLQAMCDEADFYANEARNDEGYFASNFGGHLW